MKRALASLLCCLLILFSLPVTVSASTQNYASEGWSNELSITLSEACDWLSDSEDDSLLQFCLGAAGKTAPAGIVNQLIRRITQMDMEALDLYALPYDILNITFSGYHAANVMGVNLVDAIKQINYDGAELHPVAYALLALDSNPYEVSSVVRNSPQSLVERLLHYQNSDGGFRASFGQTNSSVVQTALALAALAPHTDLEGVHVVVQRALWFLADQQQADGGYLENGVSSILPVAKVIVALKALDISIYDERFTKNDETLIDVLLRYVRVDGGFSLILDESSQFSATENAILALAAIKKSKSPYIMDTPLAESTYTETKPVVLEEAALGFDWTIPVFFGLYILLALLLGLYLFFSRMHPLLYWENAVTLRQSEQRPKFSQPPPTYEEHILPDDETKL